MQFKKTILADRDTLRNCCKSPLLLILSAAYAVLGTLNFIISLQNPFTLPSEFKFNIAHILFSSFLFLFIPYALELALIYITNRKYDDSQKLRIHFIILQIIVIVQIICLLAFTVSLWYGLDAEAQNIKARNSQPETSGWDVFFSGIGLTAKFFGYIILVVLVLSIILYFIFICFFLNGMKKRTSGFQIKFRSALALGIVSVISSFFMGMYVPETIFAFLEEMNLESLSLVIFSAMPLTITVVYAIIGIRLWIISNPDNTDPLSLQSPPIVPYNPQ
ncbi:MAG: hypothetical protein IKB73_01980 [Ruminococcus sp.]|nr:hypothetical protein [Ruminococcus sp.]